jgi:hypothetical protein
VRSQCSTPSGQVRNRIPRRAAKGSLEGLALAGVEQESSCRGGLEPTPKFRKFHDLIVRLQFRNDRQLSETEESNRGGSREAPDAIRGDLETEFRHLRPNPWASPGGIGLPTINDFEIGWSSFPTGPLE